MSKPGSVPPRRHQAIAEERAALLLGATLHAEAGDRPVRAIEALAALVVTRARLAAADTAGRMRYAPALPAGRVAGWPDLLAACCRAPFAFKGWRSASGRAAMAASAVSGGSRFAACRRIAARAMAGHLLDPTGGATHWHTTDEAPAWSRGAVPVAEIGGMVFYRLG